MPIKKVHLILLLLAFTAILGCQKDIPLLGQDENGNTVVDTPAFAYISSIVLFSFPQNDPATLLPWDDGQIQPFDSIDFRGPDLYFNFQYYHGDTLTPFSFYQATRFQDVSFPADAPLVYNLTDPLKVPTVYLNHDSVFYLRIYDMDYNVPLNDSTLIDSVGFAISPDPTQTNQYIRQVDGTGFNGSQVSLGLTWQ